MTTRQKDYAFFLAVISAVCAIFGFLYLTQAKKAQTELVYRLHRERAADARALGNYFDSVCVQNRESSNSEQCTALAKAFLVLASSQIMRPVK